MKPIFIHAMWRTGSTYVWKKFRDQPRYRAYYEPLHQNLATAWPATGWVKQVRERLRGIVADGSESATTAMNQTLRHPALERPYFDEYPLRWRGGVAHFAKRFSYESYWLDSNADDPALHRYLLHLIAFASERHQTPVFQFNRSLLRSGWMKNSITSTNILLLRKPIDVWRSFCTLPDYLMARIAQIVSLNRQHPFLERLATAHGIPHHRDRNIRREMQFYTQFHRSQPIADMYALFYEFYFLTCIYNMHHADCVIDMNAITHSATAREAVANRLAQADIDLSLEDCRIPAYSDWSAQEREWMAYEAAGRESILQNLPDGFLIPRQRLQGHAACLSPYFIDALGEFTI